MPSAGGTSTALAYLDQQHKDAEEWAEILRVQSLVLLLTLIDSNPTEAAKLGIQRDQLVALPRTALRL